ncbi:hypothetical protein CYY_000858 [Polysphondylium violaceum]|uniref:Peptidase M8 n=1 Tax=Polysphondylium violaceum TaxID=133409 RepID=A0A8J4Q0Q7_9MYCE|nr:hypothetical protein CYY_000858 [Polysphondylium violaceum]
MKRYSSSSSSNSRPVSVLCVLALLLAIVAAHSHVTDQSSEIIDHIISKNYLKFARHVDELKSSGEFEQMFDSSSSDGSIDVQLVDGHLPGYDCQHDNIMQTRKIVKPKDNKDMLPRKHYDRLNKQHDDELVQETNANVGPIRINFDTTFLHSKKDPMGCYSTGQKVTFGNGGRGINCSLASEPNCIYTCQANEIFTDALGNLIEQVILPTIRDVFSAFLSVNRVDGNLVLTDTYADRECDNNYRIPDYYFEKGIANTDIVMFITARPTFSSATIATALACSFPIYNNNFFGRPYAAGINFNPYYFKPLLNNPNQFLFKEYIRVGLHEATHALGFSRIFYDSFLNPSTGQKYGYSPSYSFTDSAPTPSGPVSVTRSGIRTPNVVNFVREHYDCASLQHQLLEDAGGQGTAGSHWEKRTVGEEYMLGYVQPVFPITGLTLALLADSGWYAINNTYVEPLMWGRKLGCSWFAGCTATSWSATGYFANSIKDSCTPTRVGKGTVRVYSYDKDLAPEYRHFDNATIGGADYAADYCPYSDVTPNFRQNAYCVDEANQRIASKSIGEYYGSDSRCFEYTSLGSSSQACWKYQCTADKKLQILVKSTWVTCLPGSSPTVDGIAVQCPKNFYICDFNVIPIPGLGNLTMPVDSASSVSSSATLILLSLLSLFSLFILI